MAETPIVSDSLQTEFRSNFPSQVSSGRDLHVSDVIVPIVDFSTTVGTSGIRADLQEALSFGNNTSFDVDSATTDITSSAGFYRILGTIYLPKEDPATSIGQIQITDGATTKVLFALINDNHTSGSQGDSESFDFNVFVRSGDTVQAEADNQGRVLVTVRQIADISGTLVNPTGYTGS